MDTDDSSLTAAPPDCAQHLGAVSRPDALAMTPESPRGPALHRINVQPRKWRSGPRSQRLLAWIAAGGIIALSFALSWLASSA